MLHIVLERDLQCFQKAPFGEVSWTPKMRQLGKVEPCP
jgi:hypothetical protein